MQAHSDRWMFREHVDEGQIAVRVGVFENVLEIAYRLVAMKQEDELKFPHERTSQQWSETTEYPTSFAIHKWGKKSV